MGEEAFLCSIEPEFLLNVLRFGWLNVWDNVATLRKGEKERERERK